MSRIEDGTRPDDEPDDRSLRHRLARLRTDLQDRLWRKDEKWAADHGLTAERSRSGWSITIRRPGDPR
jgi:hypothetical protein